MSFVCFVSFPQLAYTSVFSSLSVLQVISPEAGHVLIANSTIPFASSSSRSSGAYIRPPGRVDTRHLSSLFVESNSTSAYGIRSSMPPFHPPFQPCPPPVHYPAYPVYPSYAALSHTTYPPALPTPQPSSQPSQPSSGPPPTPSVPLTLSSSVPPLRPGK
ncbi:hypothetical protein BDV93DRAFT_552589 [Ceratobasidium sp. AG-I]|nr:hypothetical protein BDV93DRAFT_552589 [Ceratobasidium sp. AG-I]